MSELQDDSDIQAMCRLRDGDDLALNEIMDRWRRRVTAYLLRLTGSESAALDLAEETFVRLYQSRGRYRPGGAFSTWLFTIATNLARQQARWLRRHPSVSLDEKDGEGRAGFEKADADTPWPDEAAERKERGEAVRSAIASLPDDLRETVLLFEYENLGHREIASVAGCSPKAVETRLYRARAILREKLARWLQT